METIQIETIGDKIYTTTPYDREYIARAKEIGGRWDRAREQWYFDADNKVLLMNILRDVYGYEIGDVGKTVTIRVKAFDFEKGSSIVVGPVEVARRYSRDSSVSMKNGAIVVQGKFPHKGGSRTNPRIESYESEEEVIIEIKDFPEMYLKSLREDEYEIVKSTTSLESLEKKRDEVVKTIKELNNQLAGIMNEIEKFNKK